MTKLLVDVNDKVTKGQKLMELDMTNSSPIGKLKIDRNVLKVPGFSSHRSGNSGISCRSSGCLADAEKLEENKLLEKLVHFKSELDATSKVVDDAKRA